MAAAKKASSSSRHSRLNAGSRVRAAFEGALVAGVHSAVRRASLDRDAYCLVLNYGSDPARSCVPVVGVGLALPGEAIKWPKIPLSTKAEEVWNPGEFSLLGDARLQPRSAELRRLDLQLTAAARSGKDVDLRSLCNGAAVRLNRMDWTPLRRTTPFLVYATDDDLADLEGNLSIAIRSARKA